MSFLVPARYCGPPESGNGGWVSGRLASLVDTDDAAPAVAVRLSSPPPLDRPLVVQRSRGTVQLLDGGHLVARGTPAPEPAIDGIPGPISPIEARTASDRFDLTGQRHPFPTCFVCGPLRAEGDGLRIFPGPVEGAPRPTTAAVWRPTESSVELVWAALDCPGGWALGIDETPMVLGTMTARVLELPTVGDELVVLGWERGIEGRKHHCGTVLYAGSRLLGHAEATWIAVDPASVRPRDVAEAEATRDG